VLRHRPSQVVEIGMAVGSSTLAILSALSQTGGRLISIDPDESSQWHGVGLACVKRAGFAEQHELMEDFDYRALPELLRRGERIDFAYVDGWHTFDYTLLDFFYIDKMLSVGGVVGFNDCDLRAVHRVIRFVQRYRHYTEIDVGLKRHYSASQIGRTAAKWLEAPTRVEHAWNLARSTAFTACLMLEGRPSNDRYFRKDEHWEPSWKFYTSL
jgi:predicted O-methyltransferase YrrM